MSETKLVSPVAAYVCFRYSDTASEFPGELRYFYPTGGPEGYDITGKSRCKPIAAYVPGITTLEVPNAGTLHRYPEGDISKPTLRVAPNAKLAGAHGFDYEGAVDHPTRWVQIGSRDVLDAEGEVRAKLYSTYNGADGKIDSNYGPLLRHHELDYGSAVEVFSPPAQPTNPKQLYGDKKLPLSLVPTSFINATSVALLEGALKYGSNNYRVSPVEAMTYAHACMRHLLKWVHGEDSDPETHVPHLANAAACLAILVDTGVHKTLIDNRPPKQDTSEQVKELEATVAHLRELFKDKAPTHYTQANTN